MEKRVFLKSLEAVIEISRLVEMVCIPYKRRFFVFIPHCIGSE